MKKRAVLLVVILSLLSVMSVFAQDNEFPEAEIVHDEGGPVAITGEVAYTNPRFTNGVAEPLVILEDQTGFVDRNEYYLFPPQSQVIGQITSDFFTSPFSYSLALPIEPQGSLRDVDHDGEEDTGVMVFAVAYWSNTWGDPFLEERDLYGGGWSGAYASTRISTDPEKRLEVVGGKYVIFAPDDNQGFPSGFGEDGLLFTEDDPIVSIPQGYSVVNLDADPFTFDRARRQVIDLIEPESAALVDYSDLSYSEAFDAMIEKFRTEYAFTEYHHLDWDALSEEFRPNFVRAEEKNDPSAYFRNLREFLWRIPDGHVGASPPTLFIDDLRFNSGSGIGINIAETSDNEAIVTFVLEGSAAEQEGIELGAEILALDGKPILDVIDNTIPWPYPIFQPNSTDFRFRLAKTAFATRFPADQREVEITYRNPGGEEKTATLQTSSETVTLQNAVESQSFTFDGFETPVEYDLLPSGYVYASIYSFNDNSLLTIQIWERMIRQLNQNGIRGLILDLRQNAGGSGYLADQMAAYFFEEPLTLGKSGSYSEELGEFYFDPRAEDRYYLPPEELRYDGELVVLIGPNCLSACEFMSYDMSLEDRATFVGHYPTGGLGGGIDDFLMPEGVSIRFTVSRALDVDGNVHIEGKGVQPDITVPITVESLLGEEDTVLDTAIAFLDGETDPTANLETIRAGDTVDGEFVEGERDRYLVELEGDVSIDIFVGNEDDSITTVIRFFDQNGTLLFSNEDDQSEGSGSTLISGLTPNADGTFILEVGTLDDAESGVYILSIRRSP